MATYVKDHPLRSMIGVAVALAILALGFCVATANLGSGGGAKLDDRGGKTLVRDDSAGDDRGGDRSNQ